jgi:hypothetical protein
MYESDVVEKFAATSWDGPFDTATQARALAALESGRLIFLPQLAFRVRDEERSLLAATAGGAARKNISLEPQLGTIQNAAADADGAKLCAMIDRFGRQATTLIKALIPPYADSLERARTSFRPVEIEGRSASPRHDDRLLHVDAFPSRPTHGKRILRVFSNVAPDGRERQWQVGEPFPDFAAKFLPRLPAYLPGSAWLLQALGITKGRRSRYDQIMLSLHDAAKLDAAYQGAAPRVSLSFPPGSTWAVFTDQVLHAAMAGRCALEQTLLLPMTGMAEPARAPLRVLERMAGRALA